MSSMPSSVPLSSNSPIPACHTVNSHDNTLQPLQTWWMCLEALACHIKHNTSRRLGNGITLPSWQWLSPRLAVGDRKSYSYLSLWLHVSMHSARHLLQLQLKSRCQYQLATNTQAAYSNYTVDAMRCSTHHNSKSHRGFVTNMH